jgi:hypothetical protein
MLRLQSRAIDQWSYRMDETSQATTTDLQHRSAKLETQLAEARRMRIPRGHYRTALFVAPLVLAASWAFPDQNPASVDVAQRLADAERRLSQLESRLLGGPGNTTQIRSPFEVIGDGGSVILQVTDGPAVRGAVGISRQAERGGTIGVFHNGTEVAGMGPSLAGHGAVFASDKEGNPRVLVQGAGGVAVLDASRKELASLVATDEGTGRVTIWHGETKVASLGEVGGAGILRLAEASGAATAELGPGQNRNTALRVFGPTGVAVAALGADPARGHTGSLLVTNAVGGVSAAVMGGERGAVIVADPAGQTVAELGVTADARGMLQIVHAGSTVAVLSRGENGGMLQLASNGGTPTVEAGTTASGVGTVRAGPMYKCFPAQPATPVMSFGLPDCLVGKN